MVPYPRGWGWPEQVPRKRYQDHLNLGHDVAIAEPHNPESLLLKIGHAPSVIGDLGIKAVLITVHLDDQSCSKAAEVRDVRSNHNLSAEMRALDRQAMSQMPPEPSLGLGHAPPQGSRHGSRPS